MRITLIAGEKIGNLIFIRTTPELNKNWENKGLFLCSCGKEFVTRINSVVAGKSRSCGCYAKSGALIKNNYKEGEMINGVVFLRRIESCENPTADFLCECGKVFTSRIDAVKGGRTKSCGCYNKKIISQPKNKYINGDKIGVLTFIERVDGSIGKPMAKFLCECGSEFVTRIQNAQSGDTKSCGCKTKEFIIAAAKTITRPKGIPRSPIKEMPKLNKEEIDRFWSKVAFTANPNLCWNWVATGRRYGAVTIRGSSYKANRLAYYLHYGVDPLKFETLHSCDNTKCCNPAHLSLGTHADNMSDMVKKGRQGIRWGKPINSQVNDNQ